MPEELDQQLSEAQSTRGLRVAVELGHLRHEGDHLDPLGTGRDRGAAKEDGEAEEITRLAPPRSVSVRFELRVRDRVSDPKFYGVGQVREDGPHDASQRGVELRVGRQVGDTYVRGWHPHDPRRLSAALRATAVWVGGGRQHDGGCPTEG